MNLFQTAAIALSTIAFCSAPSWADTGSESFVQENATLVLDTLADSSLDADARTSQFNIYMDEFSNFNRISNFVIGKYSRRFSEDEMVRYRTAFRNYSLASYEAQFDEYRGSIIDVTGSTDRTERDSIVDSVIRQDTGEELDVRWRVMQRNGKYEVVDIALNIDGNLLWLGIEQRAQFLDLLDSSNGSADALIAKLEELTADLESDR